MCFRTVEKYLSPLRRITNYPFPHLQIHRLHQDSPRPSPLPIFLDFFHLPPPHLDSL